MVKPGEVQLLSEGASKVAMFQAPDLKIFFARSCLLDIDANV
jgi:hypothetical protein